MGVAAIPAWVSIAATAASTAVGVAGAVQSASAQSSAAGYQAAVAQNNQKIANQNAQYAVQQGQIEEQAKRQQTAQLISQERAGAAAAGIDLNTGSPLREQGDTAKLGEIDALTIRNNAARAAYGYTVQGLDYGSQASLDQSASRAALTGGALNAFGSIIGGASSVSSKWWKYQNAGVGQSGGYDSSFDNPNLYG
ncbi:hypothetical protein [Paraburkholderia kururiensis]|uniref:hypothetical protein n=1 Tax=Paraburkholderia kururiensis TaxID=984307 RepID=UPI00034C2755|nr:hypothetical protein [Paraburkholderia kururiensis]